VLLRLATADDAPGVRAVYAPLVESSVISFEIVVPAVDEVATRITSRQPDHPWLVAEDEEGIAGYAYAGRFAARPAYDWSVETSVYLAERARGQGLGGRLCRALLAILTAQGYRQAMAGVALPNPASVRLHESVGYELVGVYRASGWKFGAWHDVGWWQRALDPQGDGAPAPPVPLDRLPPEVLPAALSR
jgi:phosphinothricin acetyltransferase